MRQYIALIHKEADSDYGVSFPDFPGVGTAGASLDDARAITGKIIESDSGMWQIGRKVQRGAKLWSIL